MIEADLYQLLKVRYQAPEWTILPQVANGTGFSRNQRRYADAIGVSTFPSRGLSIAGFEIKVTRSDWLNERKNPQKAEDMAKYCHEWWLVVPDKEMVPLDELPPRWGLLAVSGKFLKAVRKAEYNKTPTPIDMPLLAALCRRLSDERELLLRTTVPRADLRKEIDEGVKQELEFQARDRSRLEEANEQLKEDVAALYRAFGLEGGSYYSRRAEISKLAPLIKLLSGGHSQNRFGWTIDEVSKRLARLRETLESDLADVVTQLKKMEAEFDKVVPKEKS